MQASPVAAGTTPATTTEKPKRKNLSTQYNKASLTTKERSAQNSLSIVNKYGSNTSTAKKPAGVKPANEKGDGKIRVFKNKTVSGSMRAQNPYQGKYDSLA